MTRPANLMRAQIREEMAADGITWKGPIGEEGDNFFAMAAGFLMGKRITTRQRLGEVEAQLQTLATLMEHGLPSETDPVLWILLSGAIENLKEAAK